MTTGDITTCAENILMKAYNRIWIRFCRNDGVLAIVHIIIWIYNIYGVSLASVDKQVNSKSNKKQNEYELRFFQVSCFLNRSFKCCGKFCIYILPQHAARNLI